MRKTIVKTLIAAVGATSISYLLAQWETGQLFPQSTQSFLADIRRADPLMYGILRDNLEETEKIRKEFRRTKDGAALRQNISDLAAKVAYPTYMLTSDEKAINVAKAGRELIEAFAAHAPDGCKTFTETGAIAPHHINHPDIGPRFLTYSEAMLQAYEDGKGGSFKPLLLGAELKHIVEVSADVMLPFDINLSSPTLCDGLIKMYNIEQVPELQGKYARFLMTGE